MGYPITKYSVQEFVSFVKKIIFFSNFGRKDSLDKIEDGRLWLCIEDEHSRFEDSIMPKQHLIHIFPFILCRELRYFEDIVKL